MKYENFQLIMGDGNVNVIHQWIPEANPDFVVVFSHGMAEHALRYEELASFICENNGAIIIEDHRGHGKTAEADGLTQGQIGNENFKRCSEDIHEEILLAKNKFQGTKIILIGHSYGSFIVQHFIENYGREIDGAILLGTAGPRNFTVAMARVIGIIMRFFSGKNKCSKLLHGMVFGSYNKRIVNAKTEFDWISSDEISVGMYVMDKMCGYVCSCAFMCNMFALLANIHKKRSIKKIPRDLPVKIMSGTDDPVGSYGKTVSNLASVYCRNGIRNVSLKLYAGARHEILNDKCRYDVINEIISFCKK